MSAQSSIVLFLIQFFTGYLLQGLAFVLFIYAYNHKKINIQKYAIVSAITVAFLFISRNIHINFGVHTILNIVLLVLLSTIYLQFPVIKSTIGCLIITLLMFALELATVGIEMLIIGSNYSLLMTDVMWVAIFAIPSTVLLFLITFIYYKIATRK